MNIRYMRTAHLDQLKSNIQGNMDKYLQTETWLHTYFDDANWNLPTNMVVDDINLIESADPKSDLENAQRLYLALRHLNLTQASDERLWSYLTHVTFWKYMHARWPVEAKLEKDTSSFIRERYFFASSNRDRSVVRNGIARLWWYGYTSFDENRNDPFELTKVLLTTQDIAQNLLERSFSRNPVVTKTILSVLAQRDRDNDPVYRREQFRNLMMYINNLGGVTILDALDADDIEKILNKKIEKYA